MLIDDIKNGETDQLEFNEVPNRDSAKWLKTAVAFANGRGIGSGVEFNLRWIWSYPS